MIPAVKVTTANGLIGGALNTNDGVVGMVLTGNGTGTLALLAPIKVVSLSDAYSKGVTLTAEPIAYKFVREFYSVAPAGSVLYLMLAAASVSLQSLMDITNQNGLKKLLDFAQGTIRVAGVSRTPDGSYVPATTEFIDSDCRLAIAGAQALQQAYFQAHTPLRIIIAARVATETNGTVYAPNTAAANGVALAIGDTTAGGGVAMGLVLGRVAATAVHTNIGRVKDGPLGINAFFIGTKPTQPQGSAPWYQQLDTLIDAGYITATTYPQKAGYYLSDDLMATDATDDYQALAFGRVIDKASIIAYSTFINELKNDVDLDANGNIAAVVIKSLQATITNNIKLAMANSLANDPVVYINPAQQLTATSKMQVKLRLQRRGYLKLIEVELGFYNPNQTNA